jgi:hypothetical protein
MLLRKSPSINDYYHLLIKAHQLKQRALNACTENINYMQQLIDFCTNNSHNAILLFRIKAYHKYLMQGGMTEQEAAKGCLEFYRH